MSKPITIVLTALVLILSCQSRQKEAKEIPMDTFVKMYVSALRVDSLMKQYQRPEMFPDQELKLIFEKHDFSSRDFKFTYNVLTRTPDKKKELDSLLKAAIEAETMKSLN